jgi:hypothetical protein
MLLAIVPGVGFAHEQAPVKYQRVALYRAPVVVVERRVYVDHDFRTVESIDRELSMQQRRIEQGRRSGELTHGEAERLRAEQRAIMKREHRYLADGHLSASERDDLERRLNRAGHRIYNQKHDRQARN